MLAGDSMVENSPPTVGTSLYHVVVNSDAAPRLLDLKHVFVDPDVNDEISISIFSNTNATIVTPYLQGEELLLEFSGVLGNSIITLRGTDSQGESVLSGFHVDVLDGGSSISATVSDVSSIKPVGTVEAELSPPDVLNAWEPAALEVWYTVGEDTPSEPFDFGVRFQGLASHFEPPTSHASLGAHMSIQHYEIDQWHSTYASILDLDLSSYQIGDKVLIASFVYAPAAETNGSVPRQQQEAFPSLSHEKLFEVTEAVFVGMKRGVIEPYVASQIAPVVYDANDDGRVGLTDFAQFVSLYGKSSYLSKASYDAAARWFDYNRDGRVGLGDFALFVGNYGKRLGIHSEFAMPGLTIPLHEVEGVNTPSTVDIPIAGVVDHVFDENHQILYVTTSDGALERWSYDGQTLLDRFEDIATTPRGFDITSDGRFAYVGDAVVENSQGTVWKVDLSDGSKTALVYDLVSLEQGVYDLAISSDGKAFFTTTFAGSGWNALHAIDLATGQISNLMNVRQSTGITRGADRSLLFFQESNYSLGPIFTYDADEEIFSSEMRTDRFVGNLPAAVGPQGEAVVFNNVLLSEDLDRDMVGEEFGYAPTFDHTGTFVFSIDAMANEVLVLDARNLKLLRRISIGADVSDDVKVSISSDSQRLFVTTTTGIRQIATTIPGTNLDDLQTPTGEATRFFSASSEFVAHWLTIQFDEPVAGVTLDDVRLIRDGGGNLLNGDQSLFTIDGGRTWILFGVRSLMTPAGTYALHVEADGSRIKDLNGNLMTSDFYQVWTRLLDKAEDIHVPLDGIRDQVYDESRGILYVTTENGSLQRWEVASQSLLSSINHIAVSPSGLDVTVDGQYAYVGEGASAIGQGVVWKVDLQTGLKSPFRYTYDFGERGVADIGISADGKAFVTTYYAGSGWTPLRSIDVPTGLVTTYRDVRQSTSITRNVNRSLLFFQEANSSAGPIFTYDASRQSLSDSFSTDRYLGSRPAAVSHDGARIAIIDSILDSNDLSTTSIGISNVAAFAFDPTRDILYAADSATDEIVAYDPITLGVIARFVIGEDISGLVRMAISEDGSLMFIGTANGLRQVPIYVREGDVVPPVGAFLAIGLQERYDEIDSVKLRFNEIVHGVTWDDFRLTLNGGENLLTGSETITTDDGGLNWVIEGLDQLTRNLGDYQLQLIADGSGIQDASGNLLIWDMSVDWEVISRESGGELLSIVDARDHVFDETTGTLYVTTPGGQLQRWHLASRTLLESFDDISDNPSGLDISRDGLFAYIGEGTSGESEGIVWKVDLSDGSKTALVYNLAASEQGVYDLVIASNDKAYFTTDRYHPGRTALHELDLTSGQIRNLPTLGENSGITRGADRSLLFFQERGTSVGPIFTRDSSTGEFSDKTYIDRFVGDLPAAVSRDGNLLAFLGSIYDANDLSSSTPTGLTNVGGYIFDPSRDVLYVANYQSNTIIAFDPINLVEMDSFLIGESIFGTVDMSISDDGSVVFVTSPHGIRAVPISLPVSAARVHFTLEAEALYTDYVINSAPIVSSKVLGQLDIEEEIQEKPAQGITRDSAIGNWDSDWHRQLDYLGDPAAVTSHDQEQYTCAVDDLFDQLEESELELLLD